MNSALITGESATVSADAKPDGTVPLDHWGLIRAQGAEAASFLQGQLTNDVIHLAAGAAGAAGAARLAGFCSAKGRLQASFIVWKLADDDLLLACAADVQAITLKRLSMFVLRAKCKLTDGRTSWALHGVAGASAAMLVGDTPTWGQRELAGGTGVRLPDVDGVVRALLALPLPATHDSNNGNPNDGNRSDEPLVLGGLPVIDAAAWRALEVRSGVPLIEAATVDRFVPQMLNYELVGGVDFKKGCYPGQEVVARSQYRGTVKRRMFLFECDAPLAAGQEVFHSADAAQPAGMVVNAAPMPGLAGSVALIEVKLSALASGSLRAGSAEGALLRRGDLPYAVPSEFSLVD